MPVPSKPPGQRRRRNAGQSQWRTFEARARAGKVPPLPVRRPAWLPATRAWWKRVWRSPMAAAYLEVDLGALHRLAELVELFGRGERASTLLAEQRQLEDRFGLTPRSRQLLQWQVLAASDDGSASRPGSGAAPSSAASTVPASNVRRLRAVDPKAASA